MVRSLSAEATLMLSTVAKQSSKANDFQFPRLEHSIFILIFDPLKSLLRFDRLSFLISYFLNSFFEFLFYPIIILFSIRSLTL